MALMQDDLDLNPTHYLNQCLQFGLFKEDLIAILAAFRMPSLRYLCHLASRYLIIRISVQHRLLCDVYIMSKLLSTEAYARLCEVCLNRFFKDVRMCLPYKYYTNQASCNPFCAFINIFSNVLDMSVPYNLSG